MQRREARWERECEHDDDEGGDRHNMPIPRKGTFFYYFGQSKVLTPSLPSLAIPPSPLDTPTLLQLVFLHSSPLPPVRHENASPYGTRFRAWLHSLPTQTPMCLFGRAGGVRQFLQPLQADTKMRPHYGTRFRVCLHFLPPEYHCFFTMPTSPHIPHSLFLFYLVFLYCYPFRQFPFI